MHRAPAYWLTRIILGVGIVFAAATALLAWFEVSVASGCLGCNGPDGFGLPSYILEAGVALVPAGVGLIWMVRIVRGPRDEPPAWRHRDRR